MIIDRLENAKLYYAIAPRVTAGLKALAESDLVRRSDGRCEIQGNDVFALVQSYTTKPREKLAWEAHRKYIDIQYMIQGDEMMGYAPLSDMSVTQPHDVEKDIAFFQGTGSLITVKEGMFAIFWPTDAHAPGLAPAAPANIKKVVLKVAV